MKKKQFQKIWNTIALRYKSHPWHGVYIGDDAPEIVTTFIEMTPSDNVKYEIDKESGYLIVDRPQKFSNIVPALYGFIPGTYCNDEVAAYANNALDREDVTGDKDPLDICVLTEREITHGNVLVQARPIGGLRMIDHGEADDKIIAILQDDAVYGDWKDITEMPENLIERLRHYFLTYKAIPQDKLDEDAQVSIPQIYGKKEAHEVIRKSRNDYLNEYGNLESVMGERAFEAVMLGQKINKQKNDEK